MTPLSAERLPPAPVRIVLADDFTGACEIAGAASRAGLPARVTLDCNRAEFGPGVTVVDTETRLADSGEAADIVAGVGRHLREVAPGARFFKKVDSVLRGPVGAELAAFAKSQELPVVLLAPANPALGRVIQGGRYSVRGVPLEASPFAQDPHHPARTSDVRELVESAGFPQVVVAAPGDRLPDAGLVVGDTATAGDLDAWARRLGPGILAAGSGAFFAAILRQESSAGRAPAPAPALSEPVLLLSGTTAPAQRDLLAAAPDRETIAVDGLDAPHVDAWSRRIVARLRSAGRALAAIDGPVDPTPAVAQAARRAAGAAAAAAVQAGSTTHLVVEGGATAAAVIGALGWINFTVVHEWSGGVVSLRPDSAPAARLTVKPGSYPWPDALMRRLFAPAAG